MKNSLDQDHAQHCVQFNLCPNCLHRLSAGDANEQELQVWFP